MKRLLAAAFTIVLLSFGQSAQAVAPDFTVKVSARCEIPGSYKDYTATVSWRIRGSDGYAKPIGFSFAIRSGDSGSTMLMRNLYARDYSAGNPKEYWRKVYDLPGVSSGAMNAVSPDPVYRPRGSQFVYFALGQLTSGSSCHVNVPS